VNCKCDVFALDRCSRRLRIEEEGFHNGVPKRHVKAKLENKVLKAKA
jgi:hypothetical protein